MSLQISYSVQTRLECVIQSTVVHNIVINMHLFVTLYTHITRVKLKLRALSIIIYLN